MEKAVDEQTKKFLKKFSKPIKIDNLEKGIPKELDEFFTFCRNSVDKTFSGIEDLGKASEGMEKTFEVLLRLSNKKEIEPTSFTLGLIFGLSRWSFLESELAKKMEETKIKKDNYVV